MIPTRRQVCSSMRRGGRCRYRPAGDAQPRLPCRCHRAVTALDRRRAIRYADAFAGGTRVSVARFGERRLEGMIAELVEWMAAQNL